ncbi:L,D-transpeptidase [Planktotalea sp.]|uniref:L,D-transpeptidase n=1 Tax=Planktotalea sp. TaxID=2029877 RepID=UPI0025F064F8|nr:L,D-transpeptidase [Planktotalea sp.]
MLRIFFAVLILVFWMPFTASAASLVSKVDVSSQTMTVIRHGKVIYKWPVSTARKGKITPRGSYSPKSLSKYHKSSLYNNAPMPYSIFFRGNYAVHGTNQVNRLGRPASAGCVRLKTSNATRLYSLVQKHGFKNTRIVVQN